MQIAIYFFEFDGCTLSVASMVIVLNLKTWRGYIRHVSISRYAAIKFRTVCECHLYGAFVWLQTSPWLSGTVCLMQKIPSSLPLFSTIFFTSNLSMAIRYSFLDKEGPVLSTIVFNNELGSCNRTPGSSYSTICPLSITCDEHTIHHTPMRTRHGLQGTCISSRCSQVAQMYAYTLTDVKTATCLGTIVLECMLACKNTCGTFHMTLMNLYIAIGFLFSTLHNTPFLYVKIYFGVMHK